MDYTSQPLFLEPIEQTTVTEQVANRLVKLLSNGELKPGDKLPAERDLARQLNVGRTSVREALKLLTLSGLLEARRGDGTYVNTSFMGALTRHIEWPLLLNASELDRVVEVREALEVKAARLAAQRVPPRTSNASPSTSSWPPSKAVISSVRPSWIWPSTKPSPPRPTTSCWRV